MPLHQLHLVTEPRRDPVELTNVVALALAGGVDWVQLRNKSGSAASVYAEGAQLLRLTRQHAASLAINDRLDVALALGANGVHLAGQSLPVDAAVSVAAGRLIVGRSVHGLSEALTAVADGADYLTFGHVFPTTSHPGLPARGLTQLAQIVEAVEVPVLAIGGITADTLESVLKTGCAGIAVISAILADPEPDRAAARLRGALDASPQRPRRPFPNTARRDLHAAHRQPTAV
ncbi:MAG: thiamine phosphate synthase [Chloroflexi bacterium]|nr:thiamine phosphate synthase [Chloroflexota bacterium]